MKKILLLAFILALPALSQSQEIVSKQVNYLIMTLSSYRVEIGTVEPLIVKVWVFNEFNQPVPNQKVILDTQFGFFPHGNTIITNNEGVSKCPLDVSACTPQRNFDVTAHCNDRSESKWVDLVTGKPCELLIAADTTFLHGPDGDQTSVYGYITDSCGNSIQSYSEDFYILYSIESFTCLPGYFSLEQPFAQVYYGIAETELRIDQNANISGTDCFITMKAEALGADDECEAQGLSVQSLTFTILPY